MLLTFADGILCSHESSRHANSSFFLSWVRSSIFLFKWNGFISDKFDHLIKEWNNDTFLFFKIYLFYFPIGSLELLMFLIRYLLIYTSLNLR